MTAAVPTSPMRSFSDPVPLRGADRMPQRGIPAARIELRSVREAPPPLTEKEIDMCLRATD
jgi:hypothetical protein